MPLIDLKTDLKSLRYGKDTPGGGYSGQPYIQAKIPDGLKPKSPDFILRGGYLAPVDALEDIKRLGKMFGDLKSPNGLLFIAKQNVLSNSAVRTQTSGILNEGIYTPLSTLAQAGLVAFGGHLNKQGIDPFAQTGAYANGEYLYFNKIKQDNLEWNISGGATALSNRLFSLYESKIQNNIIGGYAFSNDIGLLPSNILTYRGGPGAPLGVGFTNIRFADQRTGKNNPLAVSDPNYFNGKNTKQFIPDDYLKNINSPYDKGVSGKFLRLTGARLVNAFNDQGKPVDDYFHNVYEPAVEGNTWPTNTPLIYANNTFTYTQEDLIQTEVNPTSGNHLSPNTQDFRKVLREKLQSTQKENATKLGATPFSPSYNIADNKTIEGRTNIGDPGARANNDYSSYTKGVVGPGRTDQPLDKINALAIYRSRKVTDEPIKNDLVKFRIAAIDGSSPNFKTFIHFRAFIDNFSDSYNASWGSVRYLGRGENFYNYNGFDRTISLSFTVAAQSKPELIPMYKKLNYLASNLAPDYSPYGYMRGPLVQLTMGGYLYEQPGFITALTYDVPNDTTWEIGINDEGDFDNSVKELPHRISVSSFQFTPIHNFIPSKQGLGDYNKSNQTYTNLNTDASVIDGNRYGPQRFIALSNAEVSSEGYSNLNNYDSQ